MTTTHKILFLGATGYLGGVVLDILLKHPQAKVLDITLFVTTEAKAKACSALGLKAIHGSWTDLENAAAESSVIFNMASSDILPMTEAVLAGAKRFFDRTRVVPVLIHTSGTAIVMDGAMGKHGTNRIYDDVADEEYLANLPIEVFHRPVDIAITEAHKAGYLKAYIVAPPLIWGLAKGILVDAGISNPVTTVLLVMSRFCIRRGTFGFVGEFANILSTIEVHDLARLFITLFDATVIEKRDVACGPVYYFASNGDVVAKEFFSKLAEALYKHGALKSGEITQYTEEEIKQYPVLPGFAVNTRVTATRSRSLGWKPVRTENDLLSDVEEQVRVMLSQKDDTFGASWGRWDTSN
ncbi:hypothetical protein BXZ70DRAFT_1006786 [Cristinia sonorae]|uniref:NAD(P)-binding protein n=1 Tax=Cristinia sonorae TaxID=1940300 RepID=A0A8K0URC9_9AGAR|nr:hypothetical protein BXZ70DRAFT_1006786 [Cristinia sonorae]